LLSWRFSWKNCHFVGWFFDFVIILRPITMYQDYLNCPWPLSVRRHPLPPSLPPRLQRSSPIGTGGQVLGMKVLYRRFSKIQRSDFVNRSWLPVVLHRFF
jgi:hypothetical protein